MKIGWKWGIGLVAFLAVATFLAGTALGIASAQSPEATPTPTVPGTPAAGTCSHSAEEMTAHMQDMGSDMQDMGSQMQGDMGGGTTGGGMMGNGMGGGMMGGGMMGR